MKKLNYLLLGLAGLAMASCSNDDLQAPADGTYQLTVNLPKDIATRAIGDDITAAQTLYYSVFEISGNTKTLVENNSIDLKGATSTTLSLPLVKGNSYSIAFFSQATANENSGVFTYNPEAGTVAVDYSAINSTENYLDAYDCFSANYETGAVAGAINETITLTRPMAQINWGTNDLTSSAVKNVFGENGENIVSSLTVDKAYSTFDILAGEPTGEAAPLTISNIEPSIEASFPIQGYNYLAMQYVLVPSTSDTYELTLTSQKEGDESTKIEISIPNAPLQANYRTNIYGGLLTDQANFNVTLSSTWGAPSNNIVDGALVSFTEEGTVTCVTPNLPEGVTPQMMQEKSAGAVAIGTDGEPVYFNPTSAALKTAMAEYSEIYLAPNSVITTKDHEMVVPQSGVTIHGNGATLKGGEQDFSIQTTYDDDSVIDLTISNLNGMKIWGGPKGAFTMNITLTNCTLTGGGRAASSLSLSMIRGGDETATINFNVNSCHVQNAQVGIYSSYPGTMEFNNCVFTNVGIPFNIAKKEAKPANITISNCVFNTCGILPTDTQNSAYNYAAPVRIVDNAGPEKSITLLVENCTFNDTQSKWDILLWDYRTDEVRTSYPVNLTVKNCTPADPSVYTIDKVTTMRPGMEP